MTREFKIAEKLIGPNHAPFIIAEMSGNHKQSLWSARSKEINHANSKH